MTQNSKKKRVSPFRSAPWFPYWLGIKLAAYIIIPMVLLILPGDYFDDGGKSWCLSVRLFDIECYGCGMTRACQHLIHFDWGAAYYYNPLSFVVMPILAFLWARGFWKDLKLFQTLRHKIFA